MILAGKVVLDEDRGALIEEDVAREFDTRQLKSVEFLVLDDLEAVIQILAVGGDRDIRH